jgi:hypothetical protein
MGSASSAICQPKASRALIDGQAIFLALHADIGRPARALPTELGSGSDNGRPLATNAASTSASPSTPSPALLSYSTNA